MQEQNFTLQNMRDSVLIRNGEFWNGEGKVFVKGDIVIEDGKIKYVGPARKDGNPRTVIDAEGKIILPGLFDMHVHFREPGFEYKETIETGCRAAAAGGFTGVCPMPNTEPAIDNAEMVRFIAERGTRFLPDVLPVGAITKGRSGESLAEIGEMVKAGAVAVSDDGSWVKDSHVMRLALDYSKMFDIPVLSHSLDDVLAADGVMHEGFVSTRLGLAGIPSVAETYANFRDIQLAAYTGGRLHVSHLTTEKGVDLVRQAKNDGLSVTAEVTPFHLCLTDEDLHEYNPNFKLNPPLRSSGDRDALIEGLADGTIDVFATDHAPHATEEKEWEIVNAPFGCIGLEAAFPVFYTRFIKPGKISFARGIEVMVEAPRKILGREIPEIAPDREADFTIIDINKKYTIRARDFYSKGRNCPFEGWEVNGRTELTWKGKTAWMHPELEQIFKGNANRK